MTDWLSLGKSILLAGYETSPASTEYAVWGGYRGQDEGDHWATFPTLEAAQEFCKEQLTLAEREGRTNLCLQISRQRRIEGEPFAD